jgi:8-oxo-dGTP pyrophosphatase MutT (NUDIX family)
LSERRDILERLARYASENSSDREQARRISAFISSNPKCFERSLAEGHVTGSAWLVDSTGQNVLLTHHKKLNKWLQLGGHTDGESDVLAVALREAREESGIGDLQPVFAEIFDVDVHQIPARDSEPQHFHYDIRFALRTDGKEPPVKSDESNDLAWVPINRLNEFTSEESLLRMARKWSKWR